jgi:hypothetical protein
VAFVKVGRVVLRADVSMSECCCLRGLYRCTHALVPRRVGKGNLVAIGL